MTIINEEMEKNLDEVARICADNSLPFLFLVAQQTPDEGVYNLAIKAGTSQKDKIPLLFELVILCSKLSEQQQQDLQNMLLDAVEAVPANENGETLQ